MMLRVWAIGDVRQMIVMPDLYPTDTIPVTVPMANIPGTNLSFGSADLTALMLRAGATTSLRVYDPASTRYPAPAWGMLSITNNDTQEVTIVTP